MYGNTHTCNIKCVCHMLARERGKLLKGVSTLTVGEEIKMLSILQSCKACPITQQDRFDYD